MCKLNCIYFTGGLREMFDKTSFYETLEYSYIYISLHDAVLHALYIDPSKVPGQVNKLLPWQHLLITNLGGCDNCSILVCTNSISSC